MPPLTAQDQIYLKKYIGPNYVIYNALLRNRKDNLFANDQGAIETRRLSTLFEEFGGFKGLLDDCLGIVRALAKLPPYTGSALATRVTNDFQVRKNAKLTFVAKQLMFSGKPWMDLAFLSTTAGTTEWIRPVLLVIDMTASSSHGGRKLTAEHGAFSNENEILFLPAAPFKVTALEDFNWIKHKQYLTQPTVTQEKAKDYKKVLFLSVMDYPASELNPVLATWYQAAKNNATTYEQITADELFKLVRKGGNFTQEAIITPSLQTKVQKLSVRSMLDSLLKSREIDQPTYEDLLRQNHVTDAEMPA